LEQILHLAGKFERTFECSGVLIVSPIYIMQGLPIVAFEPNSVTLFNLFFQE
jgi:hypothetical protein